MTSADADESKALLGSLTARQRQVLDLLLQHKTSKEMARELGISPHTVDQRVRFAKEKLGVERRSDLATAYRDILRICEETIYEESRIGSRAIPLQDGAGPSDRPDLIVGSPPISGARGSTDESADGRLVPAILEGPSGVLLRVGAVFFIAAAVIIIGIGGLAVLEQLSRLLK
ncbi:response regulator transcription factor [Alteraurantiacibacter aquimixticola]|uniref:LuxR family transcriptional regulator n=1 Tax=Alteraurantiacibacter aquimixticola TaxID=2489173 RepID=A0A4T3F075_9SPHN|nr:helix-turn-helix transcriptional regulator [Alteraurantiacibacter aquimixticola]TIX50451.1 LuxR family transcriptional regulator [Alteraurantiacibacter aquimixticola]